MKRLLVVLMLVFGGSLFAETAPDITIEDLIKNEEKKQEELKKFDEEFSAGQSRLKEHIQSCHEAITNKLECEDCKLSDDILEFYRKYGAYHAFSGRECVLWK